MTESRKSAGKRWIATILRRARDSLAAPGVWLRNGELADCCRAADARGRGCVATDPQAVRWTANAAIEWAAHTLAREAGIESPDRVYHAAGLALQTVNTFAPIVHDPDTGHVTAFGLAAYCAEPATELAGVLALFDEAIAALETAAPKARKAAEAETQTQAGS